MTDHRERWAMHGTHWTLPVVATPVEGLMRVRPCGTLTAAMLKALNERIAELGTTNGQDWFMTPQTLERFADHISSERPAGSSVDDCITWTSHTERVKLSRDPSGMESFYESMARAGFATSAAKAQILYGAFCQHLLDWLIVGRKPVDLGFATLEAIPMRADWIRKLFQALVLYDNKDQRVTKCTPSNIRKHISNGRLMAYDKFNKVILWNLSLRHRKAWWKGVIKTELVARKAVGPVKYMVGAKARLREKESAIYEILLSHLAQTRRAALKIPARSGKRSKTTGRIVKPSVRRVQKLLRYGKSTGRLDGRAGRKGFAKVVEGKVTNVPPLRDLPQRAADLRRTQAESNEPADGTGG